MKKYFLVVKNTWDETTTYRLNFALWRVRNVLQFLTIYVLWLALSKNQTVFGYNQSSILTYIVLGSFVSALVLSSRTQEIGENINNGDLSIFLIRPWNYFKYWFFKDIGDKAINIAFSIGEVALIIFFLKPPIFLQGSPVTLLIFIVSLVMAIFLNFLFGVLLGLIGFWSPEIWGPRFLSYILISFFAGWMFPLDIFPKVVVNFLQFLPFFYFLYFPLKLYLGQLQIGEVVMGLLISLSWIFIFIFINKYIWRLGLRKYDAVGR